MHQPAVFFLYTLCIISSASTLQRDKYERFNYQNLKASEQQSTSTPRQQQQPTQRLGALGPATAGESHQQAKAPLPHVKPANNEIQKSSHPQAHEPWRLQAATVRQPEVQRASSNVDPPHSHHLSQAGRQASIARANHASPYQHESQPGWPAVGQQQAAYLSANLPSSLELAMRQASEDESVFQPLPTIGGPGHANAYDWLTQAPPSQILRAADRPMTEAPAARTTTPHARAREVAKAPIAPESPTVATTIQPALPPPPPSPPTTTTTTTTTTHATTEIISSGVSSQLEPLVLSHQNSIIGHVQQKEYETNANISAAIEFNNQVIYEGPATMPSPALSPPAPKLSSASEDPSYFFSAIAKSNKDTNYNGEHANSNAWWALGAGDEFERVSNLTRDDFLEYCDRSPLLVNGKQRSLCRTHPRVLPVVARGIKMAIDECQARFASSRWNCSLILSHDHSATTMDSNEQQSNQLMTTTTTATRANEQIFGEVMRHPNRERSFLNALFAAAIAHSMTKACSQGELPEECSCDRKIKSKSNKGRVEWVACSDDIDYGARFSRDFTDNFDSSELDAVATIYSHNNEVGRRVFKSATDITCTCLNGENSEHGQCQTKRCWKHLGSFADVVDEIMRRYEAATHVQRSNRDPHKLRPVRRGVRKPKRKDLVYIDESPDYCQQDLRIGVLGTSNRVCNSTSQGPDSCPLLCCGRGFQKSVEHIEEDCNCKFVWCCQVKCDKCSRYVTTDICN